MNAERGRRVFLVGAQPPPVHGMAVVNAAIRERISERCNLRVINLGGATLERTLKARSLRLSNASAGLLRFSSEARSGDRLYMSASGGLGQIYEIGFLLIARRRNVRCWIHHHSYAYLNSPSSVTKLLAKAAGDLTTHVVLSNGMAKLLRERYQTKRVVAVSNAALLVDRSSQPCAPRRKLSTIGFIGNICREKGVFDFLELARAIESRGLPISTQLAGPFQDAETERAVMAVLSTLKKTTFVGPRYGADKAAFFRAIDVLIFPTRYVNEAEPLTIHEALMEGTPVIAYGRGCIPEMLSPLSGLTVPVDSDFVAPALRQLTEWLGTSDKYELASVNALSRFMQMRDDGGSRWADIESSLVT